MSCFIYTARKKITLRVRKLGDLYWVAVLLDQIGCYLLNERVAIATYMHPMDVECRNAEEVSVKDTDEMDVDASDEVGDTVCRHSEPDEFTDGSCVASDANTERLLREGFLYRIFKKTNRAEH